MFEGKLYKAVLYQQFTRFNVKFFLFLCISRILGDSA